MSKPNVGDKVSIRLHFRANGKVGGWTPVDRVGIVVKVNRVTAVVECDGWTDPETVTFERITILAEANLLGGVSELTRRIDSALAELSDLRSQLVTARQNLAEARHAVETVNERLRTATACRCQMIEETAGNWRLFQTIDCPVHSQSVEVPWP